VIEKILNLDGQISKNAEVEVRIAEIDIIDTIKNTVRKDFMRTVEDGPEKKDVKETHKKGIKSLNVLEKDHVIGRIATIDITTLAVIIGK